MPGKRKRVHFKIFERIRDHHNCPLYDDRVEVDPFTGEEKVRRGCLTEAADLNAPRVCWEGCPLYVRPPANEHEVIAEILDNLRDHVLSQMLEEHDDAD